MVGWRTGAQRSTRLRALYESFFMGIERTPPNGPGASCNRLMLEMQQAPISNATMRFRFQALHATLGAFTTYWNRTMREIEDGHLPSRSGPGPPPPDSRGGAITEAGGAGRSASRPTG